jgi:DNA adenine methylase
MSKAAEAAVATKVARPIIKWAGGKHALLSDISQHVPVKLGHYFEPFAGGASVLFHIAATRAPSRSTWATIGDMNAALTTTYSCIKDDVKEVITWLEINKKKHAQDKDKFFYWLRAQEPTNKCEIAARFITLNKLGFNGLYRVNMAGKFNVPYGKWASVPNVCDEENLRAVALVLKKVRVEHGDFQKISSRATRGDFVYFDPPYWPVSATADFTAYTKDKFGPGEQERLRDHALHLKRNGVHVLLSNSDVPPIRKLYKSFCFREVKVRRSINSNPEKRQKVGELLIF